MSTGDVLVPFPGPAKKMNQKPTCITTPRASTDSPPSDVPLHLPLSLNFTCKRLARGEAHVLRVRPVEKEKADYIAFKMQVSHPDWIKGRITLDRPATSKGQNRHSKSFTITLSLTVLPFLLPY